MKKVVKWQKISSLLKYFLRQRLNVWIFSHVCCFRYILDILQCIYKILFVIVSNRYYNNIWMIWVYLYSIKQIRSRKRRIDLYCIYDLSCLVVIPKHNELKHVISCNVVGPSSSSCNLEFDWVVRKNKIKSLDKL